MVFSSLVFLFAYLPAVLLVYYLSPLHWRNAVLFAVSLLFYGWGEPVYILLMMASVTSAYIFGFLIARCRDEKPAQARRWMLVSVLINLSFLFFFKYYNFFASVLRLPQIAGLSLPIGISFYTFQILSYTIDLWRGETAVQRSYVAFGTYVTLFPQLIAGPIVRYQEIDEQLQARFAAQEKRLEVQKAYYDKFKKVLTMKQVQQLYDRPDVARKFPPRGQGRPQMPRR